MRLFSNIISGMFHPLLMITYGVILALSFTYLAIYPPTMKLFLVGGAFLSTAVVPGIFIFLMVKRPGTDRPQRTGSSLPNHHHLHHGLYILYVQDDDPVLVPLVADGGLRSIALFPVH